MRSPRAGIVVGVIGLVLLGAGWWLAGVGAAGPRPKPTAPIVGLRPPTQLLRALQQYLGRPVTPRSIPVPAPRALIAPHGTTCPVAAGGFCSVQPCIVFAGHATGAVISVGPQVVVRPRLGAGATCQGHPPPARTVPVSGF